MIWYLWYQLWFIIPTNSNTTYIRHNVKTVWFLYRLLIVSFRRGFTHLNIPSTQERYIKRRTQPNCFPISTDERNIKRRARPNYFSISTDEIYTASGIGLTWVSTNRALCANMTTVSRKLIKQSVKTLVMQCTNNNWTTQIFICILI